MKPTSYQAGQRAEQVAANFLAYKGCQIVARNWRTRYCEIDVIARRHGIIYFCEVKYRRQPQQGTGLEHITPAKLKRMQFAAELWVARHNWRSAYQLCAVEVSGPDFRITAVVKDL